MPEVKEVKKEDIFKREIKTANPWFDPEFNKVEAFGGEPGFKVDDIPERLGLLHEKAPVSLLGKDFVKGSITSNEIADDSITSPKLFDKAVLNKKLHDACVTANKIANEAIIEAKIAADAVTATKIAVAALDGITGAIASDHIIAGMLQTDCVTEAKILADAVTAAKISVAGLDGVTGNVATDHIIAGMLQTDCVTEAKILADAITALKINVAGLDGITGAIASDHIIAGMLQTDCVTEAKILAGAITATKTSLAAINATDGTLNTNSVGSLQIQTDAVTGAKILADAITALKINVSGLDGASGDVAANHIVAGMIQTDAITSVKIQAGAILANKLTTYNFILSAGSWTDDSPAAGSVAWSGCKVVYNGTESTITDNNTANKFIYWQSASPTVFATSATLPSLGDSDFIVAENLSGTHLLVWNSTLIDGGRIRTGSVTATNIAAGTITATEIATNAITSIKILADAVTAAKINVVGLDGTSGRIIVADATDANEVTAGINASATTLIAPGKIVISGAVNLEDWRHASDLTLIDGGDIYASSVTASQIAAGTITADELGANCVTSVKILADAVTASKINVVGLDGSTGRIIVADVTDANVVAGGINSYATTLIAPGKVLISGATVLSDWSHGTDATLIDGGEVYANSITATQIAALTITANELATNCVTSVKILADAVTASKINVVGLDGATGRIIVADVTDADEVTAGVNAYATTLIAPGKVLISGAVNLDDWRHGTDATLIDGGKVYANSITATQIDALTITAAEIAANAITGVKIAADAVTATKINVVGLDGATGRIVVVDATDANEVTAGINAHAVTLISAGKVLISGAVNLDDWRSGVDATYIDGGKIYAQSVTAAQILAGTITADEIHAGTITADELILEQGQHWRSMPSDTTRNSNDTQKSTNSATYVKLKEIKINEVTGKMRIYFELKSGVIDYDAYARIYKNGVGYGTERSIASTTYSSFTEDLGGFAVDDLIQIGVRVDAGGEHGYVKNFRLQYDRAVTLLTGTELEVGIATTNQTVYSVTNQDP